MAVVFGWNYFKIREFTLEEIGIHKKAEPGTNFEVRQAYFHLFWIPFFSLGKRWVICMADKTYDMPAEMITLAQKKLTKIKTPWYTYAGPLAIVAGTFIFWVVINFGQMQDHKKWVSSFNAEQAALESKLQKLSTKDFITVQQTDEHWNDKTLFLKVEDIKGDAIMVTPVKSNSGSFMDVEYEYARHASSLPPVKISYTQLVSAVPKIYDSSYGSAARQQAVNLMNDGSKYLVKEVVHHFMPVISDAHYGSYNSDISISFYNEGWPTIITEMKTLEGSIDWSENINKEFPTTIHKDFRDGFVISGKNYKPGDAYKFLMTLKDSTGQIHKYEIELQGADNIIKVL